MIKEIVTQRKNDCRQTAMEFADMATRYIINTMKDMAASEAALSASWMMVHLSKRDSTVEIHLAISDFVISFNGFKDGYSFNLFDPEFFDAEVTKLNGYCKDLYVDYVFDSLLTFMEECEFCNIEDQLPIDENGYRPSYEMGEWFALAF